MQEHPELIECALAIMEQAELKGEEAVLAAERREVESMEEGSSKTRALQRLEAKEADLKAASKV